jgi:exodeoxyribonuclease III
MIRLMTWNCQGAFRKKYPLVAELAPDIAVIQECEHPDRIPWKQGRPPSSVLWFGDKPTKGLGIFSWTNFAIEPIEDYDVSIRYCIPLRVTFPYQFQMIAVWAMDHKDDRHSYSGQVYQAIGIYREFIQAADTVIIGDFNSSQKTTPKSRMGNHSIITQDLHDLWLVSAYHQHHFEHHGKETRWTFYKGRKSERRTHIDYAFIPTRWLRRLVNVQLGDPKTWLVNSDHCPVIVEFEEKTPNSIV